MTELDPRPSEVPRWKVALTRLRKPVLMVAAVGTVLGGLAGYVTVYRTMASPGLPTIGLARQAEADPISILVLPLVNQTGDPAKAYIADGLTTALTGDLSRIQDAVIVPPLTALALQERKLTLQQLGNEARVRYVLQGAVSASGERLRVIAQMSDARRGLQLWSKVFEMSATDLFALQDEVTSRIRASIGPQMVLLAAREATARQRSPQVADLVLRLRAMELQQQTIAGLKEREALARQLLAVDPSNPRARAALAFSLTNQVINFQPVLRLSPRAMSDTLSQAAELTEKLLLEEPENVAIWQLKYQIAAERRDYPTAIAALERALQIDPRAPRALQLMGALHSGLGDDDKAQEWALKALAAPSYLPPVGAYSVLSYSAMRTGQYAAAVEWAQKGIDASPDNPGFRVSLATAYAMQGDAPRAQAAAAELLKRHPGWRMPANTRPWPGREAAHQDYVNNKLIPAYRLAGLPIAP